MTYALVAASSLVSTSGGSGHDDVKSSVETPSGRKCVSFNMSSKEVRKYYPFATHREDIDPSAVTKWLSGFVRKPVHFNNAWKNGRDFSQIEGQHPCCSPARAADAVAAAQRNAFELAEHLGHEVSRPWPSVGFRLYQPVNGHKDKNARLHIDEMCDSLLMVGKTPVGRFTHTFAEQDSEDMEASKSKCTPRSMPSSRASSSENTVPPPKMPEDGGDSDATKQRFLSSAFLIQTACLAAPAETLRAQDVTKLSVELRLRLKSALFQTLAVSGRKLKVGGRSAGAHAPPVRVETSTMIRRARARRR